MSERFLLDVAKHPLIDPAAFRARVHDLADQAQDCLLRGDELLNPEKAGAGAVREASVEAARAYIEKARVLTWQLWFEAHQGKTSEQHRQDLQGGSR